MKGTWYSWRLPESEATVEEVKHIFVPYAKDVTMSDRSVESNALCKFWSFLSTHNTWYIRAKVMCQKREVLQEASLLVKPSGKTG